MNITGGKFNSRKVTAPDSDKVRPTLSKIRASIFNMLSSLVKFEESKFLDAFSGSGIISLEAVSRGFLKVVLIEKDYKTAKIIKENYAQLGLTPDLIIKDTLTAFEKTEDKFDVIYIDPPYKNTELYNKTLELIAKKEILTQKGIFITESQKGIEYTVPSVFSKFKEKTYGDTVIRFFKYKI